MMNNKGFTLIEMLVAVVIFGIIMAGAATTFTNFVKKNPRIKKISKVNSDSKIALMLMEKDINASGFGMPPELRVVGDNNCAAGNPDFCKGGTDRLFLADGWEVLKDFTDSGDEDGNISTAQYVAISSKKEAGGYFSHLTVGASAGATVLTLDSLNIDSADEINAGNEINAGKSLILYDSDGATVDNVEGHRVTAVVAAAGTATLHNSDPILNALSPWNGTVGTKVVPAIAYYIAQYNGDPWLFRNSNKVLKGASDLQIQFGYDANKNGYIEDSEWRDTVPPDPNAGLLKSIKIQMSVEVFVQDENKTYTFNFKTINDMRN